MIDSLQSLSLQSCAAIVALVSALLAFVWARFPSGVASWLFALLMPLVISCSLYWLPVFMGADAYEYAAWAPIFIVPWYVAGAIASSLVVLLFRGHAKRRSR
jgi:hypothetical protein